MRNIAITDKTFDSNATSSYHLSVQYGERFCSYAILDPARMKYIAFRNFWFDEPVPGKDQSDHIRDILIAENYLTRHFKSVHFMYLTPLSVLVPSPLFRKENPEICFRFSPRLLPTDKILFRKMQAIDAYTVFALPDALFNLVGILLNPVHFYHQSCPEIGEAMAESRGLADHTRVLAHINPGFVDITVIKSDQLLLYNSFSIRNTDDIVFFILYMYDQFSLQQDLSPVNLSGFIEMYPGTVKLLQRYVKRALVSDFPRGYTYSPAFSDLARHQFLPLFNLARCE